MAAPKMSFLKKDPSTPKNEKKVKPDKAPKEKKPKPPADPNAPQKNFLGKEKKKPRAEYEEEIAKLKQEIAYKDGELNQLKNWARSAPIRRTLA